jgi:chemotaxis protein histidine kinase CheA
MSVAAPRLFSLLVPRRNDPELPQLPVSLAHSRPSVPGGVEPGDQQACCAMCYVLGVSGAIMAAGHVGACPYICPPEPCSKCAGPQGASNMCNLCGEVREQALVLGSVACSVIAMEPEKPLLGHILVACGGLPAEAAAMVVASAIVKPIEGDERVFVKTYTRGILAGVNLVSRENPDAGTYLSFALRPSALDPNSNRSFQRLRSEISTVGLPNVRYRSGVLAGPVAAAAGNDFDAQVNAQLAALPRTVSQPIGVGQPQMQRQRLLDDGPPELFEEYAPPQPQRQQQAAAVQPQRQQQAPAVQPRPQRQQQAAGVQPQRQQQAPAVQPQPQRQPVANDGPPELFEEFVPPHAQRQQQAAAVQPQPQQQQQAAAAGAQPSLQYLQPAGAAQLQNQRQEPGWMQQQQRFQQHMHPPQVQQAAMHAPYDLGYAQRQNQLLVGQGPVVLPAHAQQYYQPMQNQQLATQQAQQQHALVWQAAQQQQAMHGLRQQQPGLLQFPLAGAQQDPLAAYYQHAWAQQQPGGGAQPIPVWRAQGAPLVQNLPGPHAGPGGMGPGLNPFASGYGSEVLASLPPGLEYSVCLPDLMIVGKWGTMLAAYQFVLGETRGKTVKVTAETRHPLSALNAKVSKKVSDPFQSSLSTDSVGAQCSLIRPSGDLLLNLGAMVDCYREWSFAFVVYALPLAEGNLRPDRFPMNFGATADIVKEMVALAKRLNIDVALVVRVQHAISVRNVLAIVKPNDAGVLFDPLSVASPQFGSELSFLLEVRARAATQTRPQQHQQLQQQAWGDRQQRAGAEPERRRQRVGPPVPAPPGELCRKFRAGQPCFMTPCLYVHSCIQCGAVVPSADTAAHLASHPGRGQPRP